jgi:DNA-binding transcriptional MocR family regulator
VIEVLKARLEQPTARGLAHALSHAIADGALQPGQRLQPIRSVAAGLQLSPTTVSAAWALLSRAGTIRTDGRRGTIICEPSEAAPSRYRKALERHSSFDLDLSTGVPDPDLLPDLTGALHDLQPVLTPGTYLDPPVLPALERELRAGWPGSAETLTVVDGAMDALDLIVRCLVGFSDRVAVENPSFPPLLDLLDAAGAEVIGVNLDNDGPLPESLRAAVAAGARMFFCQPRAQNPTGVSMGAARAAELAAVLEPTDVLVVENDSAGSVATAPLASLADRLPNRVLHVRSFSKSHGPDLRLAALGGPAALVEPIVERRFLGQGWTSRLLQQVLLHLLTHTDTRRQVAHARAEYARRRHAMVTALAEYGVQVGGSDGINIWLPVADEAAAMVRLASRGIGATAGAPFSVGPVGRPHLRITVASIASEHARIAGELAAAAGASGWSAAR